MTRHRRRNPPSQKALPLPDWSRTDRDAWTAAQETAGVLYDGGVASHLKAYTRCDLTRRYAYFLSFLAHRGRLDPHGPAAASVTEQNILDYVHYLESRVSSVTLAQSLWKIARVASFLDPGRDWRWLGVSRDGFSFGPGRATGATTLWSSKSCTASGGG
jgi:hypothetical protein